MDSGNAERQTAEKFVCENERSEAFITAGNLPEAARILVDIVQDDPLNWRAFNNLGIISWARKKWLDAYVMFRKAVELRANYTDALINFFDVSLKLKKAHEVLPYFERALALDGSIEEIKLIRDRLVNLGEAIYLSNRALEIGTYSPLIEEADAELEAGRLVNAMSLYLKANDGEGPSASAYCGLGMVSFYQRRYGDAYALFVESIKLNPCDTDTFLNLLDAARECEKTAEAKKIFEVCRKEFPSLEAIAREFDATRCNTPC